MQQVAYDGELLHEASWNRTNDRGLLVSWMFAVSLVLQIVASSILVAGSGKKLD